MLKEDLKSIVKEFSEAYAAACEESRTEYVRSLPAGTPVPPEGRASKANTAIVTDMVLDKIPEEYL